MKRRIVLGTIVAVGALSIATSAFQGAPGGARFGPSVDVVAQDNTKTYMQNMDAFKGAGARFLPKRTFTDTTRRTRRQIAASCPKDAVTLA